MATSDPRLPSRPLYLAIKLFAETNGCRMDEIHEVLGWRGTNAALRRRLHRPTVNFFTADELCLAMHKHPIEVFGPDAYLNPLPGGEGLSAAPCPSSPTRETA